MEIHLVSKTSHLSQQRKAVLMMAFWGIVCGPVDRNCLSTGLYRDDLHCFGRISSLEMLALNLPMLYHCDTYRVFCDRIFVDVGCI